MLVTNADLSKILNLNIEEPVEYTLGMANSVRPVTMTFCDDLKYVEEINHNNNIDAIITNKEIATSFQNKKLIIQVDDPRYVFYTLHNAIGKGNYSKNPSCIHNSAFIHPKAHVSEYNVSIGANTFVGPNVTILADVEIGEDCVIQSGTVIGSEGFEYKKTSKGILPVFHDGKIIIGNRVEIGANTCVDKGFSFRYTIIENDVKIDNLIHVAHGVHIKSGAFIIAGTILGGSTTIAENAWVSVNASITPGITVGANGFVSIGAVVTKNVKDGEQVTGNFAVPHNIFLKNLKQQLKQS